MLNTIGVFGPTRGIIPPHAGTYLNVQPSLGAKVGVVPISKIFQNGSLVLLRDTAMRCEVNTFNNLTAVETLETLFLR